jgi:hypothetical protein
LPSRVGYFGKGGRVGHTFMKWVEYTLSNRELAQDLLRKNEGRGPAILMTQNPRGSSGRSHINTRILVRTSFLKTYPVTLLFLMNDRGSSLDKEGVSVELSHSKRNLRSYDSRQLQSASDVIDIMATLFDTTYWSTRNYRSVFLLIGTRRLHCQRAG